MSQRGCYPCPRCEEWVAATISSLYATRRGGRWVRYVYLRTHHNRQGRPCPGAHASADPPPSPACRCNEGKDSCHDEPKGALDGF
jgi:hypothetical protein